MTDVEQGSLPPIQSPQAIAEGIARNADSLDGRELASISPMTLGLVGALECLQCYVVLPRDGGRDFASIIVTLAVIDEPLFAQINRTALIVALEELFSRVQLFGNALAFAKYCDKQCPTGGFYQIVTNIVNNKGLH